ncbi:MAG: hypothetical protein GY804_04180 [Alphaproteobacteria bacterium]|nr:hypothetical protein [Alphaproteobacteria bacterium]
MSIITPIRPNENGGATVSGTFTDAAGGLFPPTTATYTLTDRFGNIIDSLSDIAISGYTTSYTITLSCTNLSIPTAGETLRYLLIKTTYDSGTKCATEQLEFNINDLVGIS